MRIGIIGTGSMGQMLAKAFATHGENEIYIYNRTEAKARELASSFSMMHVSSNLHELVRVSDYVLLCTKAEDGKNVMKEIGPLLERRQVLLTAISSVPLLEWERYTQNPVVKFIPSITQSTGSGIILLTFGNDCSSNEMEQVINLFSQIATPQIIRENQVRVSSDITSCGPAFLAYILRSWVEAVASTEILNYKAAEHMLCETFIGMAQLLEQGMSFDMILARVTVPGGITACGLEAMGDTPLNLFTLLHQVTQGFSHGQQTTPQGLAKEI